VGRKRKSFSISSLIIGLPRLGADGKDIESLTMRLKTDEAVEEAFAAIEKLTDADLNIDNGLDEQV
jgi:hypothetical protein